jgi:hypothetical protein
MHVGVTMAPLTIAGAYSYADGTRPVIELGACVI